MIRFILNNFFRQLEDPRLDPTDDLYVRIPDFVPMAVIGTMLFMICFCFPLWWWQWAQPQYYWKTEIAYCALSLIIKFYIGYLIYQNVIMDTSFNHAMALDFNTSLVEPMTTVITTTVTTTVTGAAATATTSSTGVAVGAFPPPPSPPVA